MKTELVCSHRIYTPIQTRRLMVRLS